MQVDKGTITKTIKSLCAAGVIKKLQDEKDKRIWHLYSADNLDEFYLEINSQYNQICSSLFNNYSEEKIELLKSYITRITNNINALKSLH
jgi:DNA-binding MarR family transcriptional regulator